MSKVSKADIDRAKRELRGEGTVHQLHAPGQEGPPVDEAGTGTWD
jgi:hypothetical protein